MKTITLDDDAYERLKTWKRGPQESFSSVVKRVVPRPGTLGSLLGFVESQGTSELAGNEVLEQAVNERPATKSDPWT